jgi:flavin reductase (DIM6/NTAB) family NADH-FMN oxidoreductase RutF
MIRNCGECVINLPNAALIDTVVRISNTWGAEIEKFKEFALMPDKVQEVKASLIRECHANFGCRLYDALVDKYNFFIFKVVRAHVAALPKHPETIHYRGEMVCSWSPARSSAESHYCCWGYCELVLVHFYDNILMKNQLPDRL